MAYDKGIIKVTPNKILQLLKICHLKCNQECPISKHLIKKFHSRKIAQLEYTVRVVDRKLIIMGCWGRYAEYWKRLWDQSQEVTTCLLSYQNFQIIYHQESLCLLSFILYIIKNHTYRDNDPEHVENKICKKIVRQISHCIIFFSLSGQQLSDDWNATIALQ